MSVVPFLPTGPEAILAGLRHHGVVVFPIMSEATVKLLASEAAELEYREDPAVYGARQVRQEVDSVDVQPGSMLRRFSDDLEVTLGRFFGAEAFASPLRFTDRNIQRYADESLGIAPHRDLSVNCNLIALLGLRGSGRFTVYEDLGGEIVARWTIKPGDLLLMVAPGFYGADASIRPVHGVDRISGDPYRYLLGLRQKV